MFLLSIPRTSIPAWKHCHRVATLDCTFAEGRFHLSAHFVTNLNPVPLFHCELHAFIQAQLFDLGVKDRGFQKERIKTYLMARMFSPTFLLFFTSVVHAHNWSEMFNLRVHFSWVTHDSIAQRTRQEQSRINNGIVNSWFLSVWPVTLAFFHIHLVAYFTLAAARPGLPRSLGRAPRTWSSSVRFDLIGFFSRTFRFLPSWRRRLYIGCWRCVGFVRW